MSITKTSKILARALEGTCLTDTEALALADDLGLFVIGVDADGDWS